MSDNTTQASDNQQQATPPLVIVTANRNNILIEFVEAKESKGPDTATVFLFPNKEYTLDEWRAIIGNDTFILKSLVSRVKKIFKCSFQDSLDENKVLVPERFKAAIEQETFATETLKELRSGLENVLREFMKVDMSTSDGVEKAMQLKVQMQSYQAKMDSRKRSAEEGDDEDDANNAAPASSVPPVAAAA